MVLTVTLIIQVFLLLLKQLVWPARFSLLCQVSGSWFVLVVDTVLSEIM